MNNKKALRQYYKEQRSALPISLCAEMSNAIVDTLYTLPEYKDSELIMAYAAIGKEPQLTDFIIRALEEGKQIALPRLTSEKGIMNGVFIQSMKDLEKGALGIGTPNASCTDIVKPSELDLILVPGLAFDEQGGRLGMGGGYYDRFLPYVRPQKRIGIAFECQICHEVVPTEQHDCYMGMIITEKRKIMIP